MAQSLKNQGIAVRFIGPLSSKYSLPLKVTKSLLYNRLLRGKKYCRARDRILLKDYARQISRKLGQMDDVGIVFSPQSPGSQPVAYLDCKQPIVIWTDATFAAALSFYPDYTNLCKETVRDGIANERAALERCSITIYSSDWAAQTAVDNYNTDPSKVRVVPYGPSLELNGELKNTRAIIDSKRRDKCKLLFFGVQWYRKGGDVALQVAAELNKTGLETELTVVGCGPVTKESFPRFVKFTGYINKRESGGIKKLSQLLCQSHFLILPTRADCTPVVFSEACSVGLPCISTKVGGIPTIIRDNVNGRMFRKDCDIGEYCNYIYELFTNWGAYRNLALSSFNEYQSRLNWSVAGAKVKQLMMELL